MKRTYVKLPDGRLAKPRVTRLEKYLKSHQSASGAGDIALSRIRSEATQQPDNDLDDWDLRELSGREVLLLGAGSVGSYLAGFLAVANLILHVIDFKRVEPKHLAGGRTTYTADDVGLYKVEALKRRLEANHTGTQVRAYPCNVVQFTTADLTVMFRRCLIVLLAIDDPEQLIRVADLAYPLVTLLQVAMHRRGHSSHMIITMPQVTPCLRCTLGIAGPHDIRRLDREPSLSGDIINLANMAANFALDIASSKITGRRISRWDLSKNRIYLSNRRDQAVGSDGPSWSFDRVQRRPGCPVCNKRMPS